MKKELKSYIESELRNYHQSKKDIEELKTDIIETSSSDDTMGIRGSGTSDTTGQKCIKLMTNKRLKKLCETVIAIDAVMNEIDENKYKLIELKYWKKPKLLSDAGIAQELSIDRATLYRWVDGILLAIAIEMGLVDGKHLRQKCDI